MPDSELANVRYWRTADLALSGAVGNAGALTSLFILAAALAIRFLQLFA